MVQLIRDVIRGCSTGQIDELSKQLLDRLLDKGHLVKIDHPLICCTGRQNNPYLQSAAYTALVKAVESVKQRITINSCLRTVMQQHMLYKQYKLRICGITAAAPPGRSNHQSGLAIDVQDYLFWKPYLTRYGWRWLGAWDRWHYDFTSGSKNLSTIQIAEWQILWNEHNKHLLLKVDGVWGAKTARTVDLAPINGFNNHLLYKKGDINREVGKMQVLLRKALSLRVSQLPADCAFGSQTAKAIALFQKKEGLTVTGEANQVTINRLLIVTGYKSLND